MATMKINTETVTTEAHGRVNLIGEHTDYNNGFVFPTLITGKTRITAKARSDRKLELASTLFPGETCRSIDDPAGGHWSDYVVGCAQILEKQGFLISGAAMSVESTVSTSGGVSSSAALEIATLRAFRDLFGLDFTDKEAAFFGQSVENNYLGVRCGILDQMAISIARSGYGLFLDTSDISFEHIPLPDTLCIKTVDSKIPRRLAESGYNQRRQECESAAEQLNVRSLREVSYDEIEKIDCLPEILKKRAKHVITENQRVLDSVVALKSGDSIRFGQLMDASHESLSTDYEVSVPGIDRLVEGARAAGAIGSRITGGGFGGCIVAAVPAEVESVWEQKMKTAFPEIEIL